MRKYRSSWTHGITAFIFLFVSILGGGVVAASSMGDHHHGHASSPRLNCAAQCSVAGTLPGHLKRDEEETDDKPQPVKSTFPGFNPFAFALIKKFNGTFDVIRQLRPPDLYAFTCSYRF
jgi:hypothetical protein